MTDFAWPFPPDPPELVPKGNPDDPDVVWVEDDGNDPKAPYPFLRTTDQ